MACRAAAIFLVFASSPAVADFDPTAYPPYETCALCHGLYGSSHMAKFPHLGGQKPDYLQAQIQAFLSGERSNDGGQMSAIVSELEPEAIPIVVEWFSTQDPPQPIDTADTTVGQLKFDELGCTSCHDNAADGAPAVPYLSAQHPGYLAKQMIDFRDGERTASAMPGLHQTQLSLPDEIIAEIATFLGAQARP